MKYKSSVYKSLVLVMQFGINMLVAIFLCTFFGIWLGKKTGIDFMAVPFFVIGALAGFRNCYIMAKKAIRDDEPLDRGSAGGRSGVSSAGNAGNRSGVSSAGNAGNRSGVSSTGSAGNRTGSVNRDGKDVKKIK